MAKRFVPQRYSPDCLRIAQGAAHRTVFLRCATKGLDLLSRPEFETESPAVDAVADHAVETACSVSDLNRRARMLLEGGIGRVRVRGEISGFTRAASGHLYFSLKDAGAQVRCALWRGKAAALAFEPKNGDAVEVRAAVTLFEARGEYQLSVESMRRAGAGALFEQFLRLKEKLAGEGLFDAERKRALPSMPRGIGIAQRRRCKRRRCAMC